MQTLSVTDAEYDLIKQALKSRAARLEHEIELEREGNRESDFIEDRTTSLNEVMELLKRL
jgi:hypothetical protein